MASDQNQAPITLTDDAEELGDAEGGIIKKYIYLAMALLILAVVVLIFLRFVLYLW